MTKKQIGEERVYSAYTSILFITKKVRTGTQAGQEAGADAKAMEGCNLKSKTMSNSSSRSVWSFIIKVIITVATAVGGLIGVQSCM